MNGLGLLQRIKQRQALNALRVIVCAAANDRETVTKALALGVRHHIVKSIDPAVVLDKLAGATVSKSAAVNYDRIPVGVSHRFR